jgi:hypothetical protein
VTKPVYIAEPAPLEVYPALSNVSCSGGNNGAINLSVSGGTFPYAYQWSNGANTQGIFNLSANSYSVMIIDHNGCFSSLNFTVTQPANPLVINAAVVDASNVSSGDGSIDITVTGGQAPYTFNWSNNVNTEDLSGLSPGAYLVNVTDVNDCVSSSTFLVGNITGIENAAVTEADIIMYPQPASDQVTFETKGFAVNKIEIYNAIGQKVFTGTMDASSLTINLAQFAGGLYHVQFHSKDQVVLKRMVINK